MDVSMGGGEEEIVALREQLRHLQNKVEHLRRTGLEQSRSLAVTVPDLEAAVELSLKVCNGLHSCSVIFRAMRLSDGT